MGVEPMAEEANFTVQTGWGAEPAEVRLEPQDYSTLERLKSPDPTGPWGRAIPREEAPQDPGRPIQFVKCAGIPPVRRCDQV